MEFTLHWVTDVKQVEILGKEADIGVSYEINFLCNWGISFTRGATQEIEDSPIYG